MTLALTILAILGIPLLAGVVGLVIHLIRMDASDARHDKRTAKSMVGRRLALAAEDETNDDLPEVIEAANRGIPLAGPYGDVHSGCLTAYRINQYERVCDPCFDRIGVPS